jgi:hypothetical protein
MARSARHGAFAKVLGRLGSAARAGPISTRGMGAEGDATLSTTAEANATSATAIVGPSAPVAAAEASSRDAAKVSMARLWRVLRRASCCRVVDPCPIVRSSGQT